MAFSSAPYTVPMGPLSALLMDVDPIEGKLPRRDERQSNKADQMTMENILWGHGGLVTGHKKCLPGFVPP